MFTYRVAAVALAAATLVSAQSDSNSTWTLDPGSVDTSDANTWCRGEYDSCTSLCEQVATNNCEEDTLDFECVCVGGGYPNMNKYENTMPWYVCTEGFTRCIADHPDDAEGQDQCKKTWDCSTTPVKEATPLPTGASSSSSPTPTPTSNGGDDSDSDSEASPSSTAPPDNAAMPTAVGNAAVVAAGIFALML